MSGRNKIRNAAPAGNLAPDWIPTDLAPTAMDTDPWNPAFAAQPQPAGQPGRWAAAREVVGNTLRDPRVQQGIGQVALQAGKGTGVIKERRDGTKKVSVWGAGKALTNPHLAVTRGVSAGGKEAGRQLFGAGRDALDARLNPTADNLDAASTQLLESAPYVAPGGSEAANWNVPTDTPAAPTTGAAYQYSQYPGTAPNQVGAYAAPTEYLPPASAHQEGLAEDW